MNVGAKKGDADVCSALVYRRSMRVVPRIRKQILTKTEVEIFDPILFFYICVLNRQKNDSNSAIGTRFSRYRF